MRLTTKSKKLGHLTPPTRFVRQAINISKTVRLDRYDWDVDTKPILAPRSSMFDTNLVCCYHADKHTDFTSMSLMWVMSCDRSHRLGYIKDNQDRHSLILSKDQNDYLDKPAHPGDIFWVNLNCGHYLSTADPATTKLFTAFYIDIPFNVIKEETFHDFQLITYMKYLVKRHLAEC